MESSINALLGNITVITYTFLLALVFFLLAIKIKLRDLFALKYASVFMGLVLFLNISSLVLFYILYAFKRVVFTQSQIIFAATSIICWLYFALYANRR